MAMDLAAVMSVSGKFERAGAIAPAIAILIGFKDKHAATMAPMELARLHCRCAGLFQLYTDNRINLRDHLCAALHALDKHKGAAASDIRGCIHLLRADLLLMENKTAAAAKEIVAADRAYGRGNEPEVMQSYSKIKSFQLKLLEDDAAGALGAVLAAVDAEKEPHFSPSRTLCRLLSAHLYLRLEQHANATRALGAAQQELELAGGGCLHTRAFFLATSSPSSASTIASPSAGSMQAVLWNYLCTLSSVAALATSSSFPRCTLVPRLAANASDQSPAIKDNNAGDATTSKAFVLHTPGAVFQVSPAHSGVGVSHGQTILSVFRLDAHASLGLSSPSVHEGILAFFESFQPSPSATRGLDSDFSSKLAQVDCGLHQFVKDKIIWTANTPQAKMLSSTLRPASVTPAKTPRPRGDDMDLTYDSDPDMSCCSGPMSSPSSKKSKTTSSSPLHGDALYEDTTTTSLVSCLLLERKIGLLLATMQLSSAASCILEFSTLVDSDALLHLRPESTRHECVCTLECCIARYLARLPGHTQDARARLRQAAQATKSYNTRVGALVYEAILLLFSEEQESHHNEVADTVQEGMPQVLDVQQLVLLVQDAKKKAIQVHHADSHSGGEADGRGGERGGGGGCGSRGQQERLQEEHLAPWQSLGLFALEALLVLRRADMHTGYEVRDAQQALIDLTCKLDTYEQDLEMAVFVAVALASYLPDVEFALQHLCKVHVRVRALSDEWLERKVLRALERCYLRSEIQENLARASLTIRKKRESQYNLSIQGVVEAQHHSAILAWKPRTL